MNYYQKNCDGIMHTVKKGDTLYRLSRMYSVSVDDIMDANPDVNVYNLQIGSSVCIPMTLPAVPPVPGEPKPVMPCPGCARRLPQPGRGKGRPEPMPEQPQDGPTDGVQPSMGGADGQPASMDGADGQQVSMDAVEGTLTGEDFTATQAVKDEMSEDSDQIPTEFVFPGMSLINRENTWNEDEGNEGWELSEDSGDTRTYAPPFDWELQRHTLEGDNSGGDEAVMPDGDGDTRDWEQDMRRPGGPGGPGMPPGGPGMWPGDPGMPPGGPGGPGMPPDWVIVQPHRVVRGETINSILETFNMDFDTFARLNPQIMPIPLMPGDTIFVKGNRPQPRVDD